MQTRTAKFAIGQVVKHRIYPFRGVIYDVDPTFANTEEWWRSIPGRGASLEGSAVAWARSRLCWPES